MQKKLSSAEVFNKKVRYWCGLKSWMKHSGTSEDEWFFAFLICLSPTDMLCPFTTELETPYKIYKETYTVELIL